MTTLLLLATLFSVSITKPIHAQAQSPTQPPVPSDKSNNPVLPVVPQKTSLSTPNPAPVSPATGAATGIANGGFENGSDGSWIEFSQLGFDLIYYKDYLPLPPHSGNWAAWLGGAYNERSTLTQTVTLPIDTTELNFWHWIISEDACGYDFATVEINNNPLLTFDLCYIEDTSQWVRQVLDVSAYAGSTVELKFDVQTDDTLNSSYFLDDVILVSPPPADAGPYLPLMPRTYWPAYFDDFNNSNSGWTSGDTTRVTYRYISGEYQIYLKQTDAGYAITPDLVLPNKYRIEVDARKVSSGVCSYGLIFGAHFTDTSYETYQVLVWPTDGEFYINKRSLDGTWTEIKDWTYTPAINLGNATNHIRVDRIGTIIKLFINDTLVAYLVDDSLSGPWRDAGIRAYSYSDAPVDVRFDNFSAEQP